MNHAPALEHPFSGARAPRGNGLARRLRRLARMPLSELAGRGRQEAYKLIDRIIAREGALDVPAALQQHAPALANPAAALRMLRERAPQRFFAGAEDPSWIAQRMPSHRAEVIAGAESALQNRFDLLGYRTLWFGEPIDWHLDPVWSRRAPRRHWSTLNPLDPASVGDSKIVWELNRHQWLVRVAEAYALTGDEQFADTCLAALAWWIEANPAGIGINWSSSLEVAYRVMSWSWILLLLRNSEALTGERLQIVLASLGMHASHVARYLSYYFSPNTHLTGEALGLFYAGTLFPEFRDADRWRRIGERVLTAEAQSQICPDGVHFERSTCYHRYTVETFQQFLLLAERNLVRVPADARDRLRLAIEFVMAVRRPDGMLPETGDADGGRLLALCDRTQCDPRGVLAVGAAMFERGDFAWAAGDVTPDVAWLMGEEGVRRFEGLEARPPRNGASRLFPSGGYVLMKTGWDRDAHQMIVDVGPLGCSFSGAHGHADLLSVQCSAFGEPVLVDAGTYCYTSEPDWRNFFRGTSAHSTLMIDGRDHVEPDGAFSWRGRAHATLREWRTNAESDFVDASHTAYVGLTHRRRVLFVKPHYWVVIDDVRGSDPIFTKVEKGLIFTQNEKMGSDPNLELGFQFGPMQVEGIDETWTRAATPKGHAFWVACFASTPVQRSIKTGERAPIRGWVSANYGQRTPAPMLVFSCRASLPWRSITVLVPARGLTHGAPQVAPVFDFNHRPTGVVRHDTGESIFVDENDFLLART